MLNKAINTLLEDVSKMNNKINEKVDALDRKINLLSDGIQDNTSEIVRLEMLDDTKTADKLRNETNTIRLNVQSLKDERESYIKLIDLPDVSKHLEEIKKVAIKARDARYKRSDELSLAIKRNESHIEQLKKEITELEQEKNYSNIKGEGAIDKILKYIDSRAPSLDHHLRQSFISKWLNGEDTNTMLRPKEENRGFTSSMSYTGNDPDMQKIFKHY